MIGNEEREFCLEDIVKITNQSFGTVYPALNDLLDSRIIITRKVGKSKLYKINTRHILYQKIRDLLKEEKTSFSKIAKEFSSVVDKKYIKNIILFGSAARGEAGEKSDIDILIIFTHPRMKKSISELVQQFLDKYDVQIVPTFLSEKEAKERVKKYDKFILNVIEDGKTLYGDFRWLEK